MIYNKKYWFSFQMSVTLFVMLAVAPVLAELTPMDDNFLADVCGTSGITIAVKNVQIFHHIDTIRYCASDNGSVEFQNFFMHGIGNPAKINYDFGTITDSGIIELDVFTPEIAPVNDWSGGGFGPGDVVQRVMTSTVVPKWDQELGYTIGNVIFHDPNTLTSYSDPIDLGSFTMGLIDMPRSATYTSPRINGSGFDFQHSFQMTIDKTGYAYNTSCDALEMNSLYIGESFSDLTGDDPSDPTTWKPNQATPVDFGDFQIGDLFGDMSDANSTNWIYSNPAMIDVGQCELYGDGDIYGLLDIRLPMSGSIRFESMDFNGTDFGPGAIDGINVHRLELQFIP